MAFCLIELKKGGADEENDSRLSAVAEILEYQWPSGSADKQQALKHRKRRILAGTNANAGSKSYSFGMYHNKHDKFVGFFRLQKAVNVPCENSCAIVSVVIDSTFRGQGFGKEMMKLAEEAARDLGFLYMYLWTNDAQAFYEKCGFETCSSISLSSPVLDLLAKNSHESGDVYNEDCDGEESGGLAFLSNLETALMNRRKEERKKHANAHDDISDANVSGSSPVQGSEDGDENMNASTIWMRKRLVLELPSVPRSTEETCSAIEKSLLLKTKNQKEITHISYYLRIIPWKQQVGPSCGMTALLGAHEFLLGNEAANKQKKSVNILEEAKKRGISHEGELFNIHGTHVLASEVLGLCANIIHLGSDRLKESNNNAKTMETENLLMPNAVNIAKLIVNDSLIIFPYDPEPGTYEPGCLKGVKAHYCTIIGFAVLMSDNVSSDSVSITRIESSEGAEQTLENSLRALENLPETILLIAQHSLKPTLVIASVKDFLLSNAQLIKAKEGRHNVSRWVTDNMDLQGKCLQVSAPPS